jgi:drug/metabolite transporter (DMT)-like permease
MTSSNKNALAYVWLILSQCMIAVNIVFTKQLLAYLHPYTILFFRFGIAFVVLFLVQLVLKPRAFAMIKTQTWQNWMAMFWQAICAGVLFNTFMLLGLHHTSASMAGMICSALPAIVVILAVIFLRVTLTRSMIVCVILAVIGLVIMNAPHTKTQHIQWFGDAMVLLSLVPEGLYYILTKRFPIKMPILLLSAILNVINVPLLALLALGHHDALSFTMPAHVWWLLSIVGLSSAGFYVFWFMGCAKVHGAAVGLSTAIMPMATIWLAVVMLGEHVHLWQVVGMCIILAAIVVHAVSKNSQA